MQAGAQLARHGGGDPPRLGVVAGAQQHDDVAGAVGRRVDDRGQRAGSTRARRPLGGRQHAAAPVVLGGRVVVRSHDDHRGSRADVHAQLGRARDDVVAVGHLAPQHRAQVLGLRRLGGALGRPHALDLGRDQRRHHAQQRRRRIARPAAQPQIADHRVADPQLVRDDALGVGGERALVGRRARGDGQHRARAVDQHERRAERPRRRPHHLRQPEPGLHGIGDLGQRVKARSRRLGPDGDRLAHHSRS